MLKSKTIEKYESEKIDTYYGDKIKKFWGTCTVNSAVPTLLCVLYDLNEFEYVTDKV